MATGSDKPQKSVVYKRVDDTNVSLEGMSFAGGEDSKSTATTAVSGQTDEQIDEATLKELLGDLPERLSDVAGLGSIPELTLMVEDDDVIAKFEDPETARCLREISMDPSKLEEFKTTNEIKWILDKLQEKKDLIMREPKYEQYREKLQSDAQAQKYM